MYSIGKSMPSALRETGEGGLAATPTGKRLKAEIFSESIPSLVDYLKQKETN
jgi:L-serine dehydratase